MNIYCDVVCDLFHPGHVSFLSIIKTKFPHANIIVGVMSDSQATQYKRKPILDVDQRCIMLDSCKYVSKTIKNAVMPITKKFMDKNDGYLSSY